MILHPNCTMQMLQHNIQYGLPGPSYHTYLHTHTCKVQMHLLVQKKHTFIYAHNHTYCYITTKQPWLEVTFIYITDGNNNKRNLSMQNDTI